MRILIFGGSFDPPHRGHAALLNAAVETIEPDRILIVPAYHAPLKGEPRASPQDRLTLIKTGILSRLPGRWRKLCRLDLSELRAKKRVYTIETLTRLSRKYREAELHFVVGSDSAATFPRWRRPDALKKICTWWAGRRPDAPEPPPFFRILPAPLPPISSTEVRAALLRGGDAGQMLEPAAYSLILKRKLYGSGITRELRKTLKPHRFEHTLCVAKLASELAERWGLDAEKAILAGLLHDCGRAIAVPEMPAFARRNKIRAPNFAGIARHNPLLVHAYISSYLARRQFHVEDPEILSAIGKHTLGGLKMSTFDRLLYIADAASYDRAFPGAVELRAAAFRDLDLAFKRCVKMKIDHARSQGAWLHPLTAQLWKTLAGR